MRCRSIRLAASVMALAGLSQPALAQSANCVDQADVADAAIYAMPALYAGFTAQCSGTLATDGFAALEGEAFIAPYRQLQEKTWPGAKALLATFAKSNDGDASETGGIGEMAALFDAMPDDSLRPFIDALIQQKIAQEIEPATCGKIERALELLAPLPPENTGGLVAMIFDFAGVDSPSLCPYRRE